jgi:hypothetical protein
MQWPQPLAKSSESFDTRALLQVISSPPCTLEAVEEVSLQAFSEK